MIDDVKDAFKITPFITTERLFNFRILQINIKVDAKSTIYKLHKYILGTQSTKTRHTIEDK